MNVIARISLTAAALAFMAGAASAQCAYSKMTMASAPPPAEASEVDVAVLVPPVPPSGTVTDQSAEPKAE